MDNNASSIRELIARTKDWKQAPDGAYQAFIYEDGKYDFTTVSNQSLALVHPALSCAIEHLLTVKKSYPSDRLTFTIGRQVNATLGIWEGTLLGLEDTQESTHYYDTITHITAYQLYPYHELAGNKWELVEINHRGCSLPLAVDTTRAFVSIADVELDRKSPQWRDRLALAQALDLPMSEALHYTFFHKGTSPSAPLTNVEFD